MTRADSLAAAVCVFIWTGNVQILAHPWRQSKTMIAGLNLPVEDIERMLRTSEPEIQKYAAVIHSTRKYVFSGVYVLTSGYAGILTAGHCAKDFLDDENVTLVVSDLAHRLQVPSSSFEHIPIAHNEAEEYTTDKPDLSFVIIRDTNLLQSLLDQKIQFYDLDNRDFITPFNEPIYKFNWSVAGNPDEQIQETVEVIDGRQANLSVVNAAVIQGSLVKMWMEDDGFDYVQIELLSGIEGFPANYTGVSGGGIWYQKLLVKDGIPYKVEPLLVGIACWQSKLIERRGLTGRTITGHCLKSIYLQARAILAKKRASES